MKMFQHKRTVLWFLKLFDFMHVVLPRPLPPRQPTVSREMIDNVLIAQRFSPLLTEKNSQAPAYVVPTRLECGGCVVLPEAILVGTHQLCVIRRMFCNHFAPLSPKIDAAFCVRYVWFGAALSSCL